MDMSEEQVRFATPSSLMGAFVFGSNGSNVVKATSVDGVWRSTRSRQPVPAAVATTESQDDETVTDEYRNEVAIAAKMANANSDDVLELTCGLMNIPSTSGEEEAVGKALENWFKSRGWEVILQPVAPQQDAKIKAGRYVHIREACNESGPYLPALDDAFSLATTFTLHVQERKLHAFCSTRTWIPCPRSSQLALMARRFTAVVPAMPRV